jgi:hypothetical protein
MPIGGYPRFLPGPLAWSPGHPGAGGKQAKITFLNLADDAKDRIVAERLAAQGCIASGPASRLVGPNVGPGVVTRALEPSGPLA